jgi:hypothetical protein
MIVTRERWFLIVGSDLNNSDWGVTFGYGPVPPDGVTYAWRTVWRINVRWPVSVQHLRRSTSLTETEKHLRWLKTGIRS